MIFKITVCSILSLNILAVFLLYKETEILWAHIEGMRADLKRQIDRLYKD